MSNLKQDMYNLEVKTTEVAKLKAVHIVASAQNILDFKHPYTGAEVLIILETIKDAIKEIEA